jgi:hypothetical protein
MFLTVIRSQPLQHFAKSVLHALQLAIVERWSGESW